MKLSDCIKLMGIALVAFSAKDLPTAVAECTATLPDGMSDGVITMGPDGRSRLTCDGCFDAAIKDCDEVICSGGGPCSGAQMQGVQDVICEGLEACIFAQVVDALKVACPGDRSCGSARFWSSDGRTTIFCTGGDSCRVARLGFDPEDNVMPVGQVFCGSASRCFTTDISSTSVECQTSCHFSCKWFKPEDPNTRRQCGDAPDFPSESPSVSVSPSTLPSVSSVPSLSTEPSESPSNSLVPSVSGEPSISNGPTASAFPSATPSESPSNSLVPSVSTKPSINPSNGPSVSAFPSVLPSMPPSVLPSSSTTPSRSPTGTPSSSAGPSVLPSDTPSTSAGPTIMPSLLPSVSSAPSSFPTLEPSSKPSSKPSASSMPSSKPSASSMPSSKPSETPMLTCKSAATLDILSTQPVSITMFPEFLLATVPSNVAGYTYSTSGQLLSCDDNGTVLQVEVTATFKSGQKDACTVPVAVTNTNNSCQGKLNKWWLDFVDFWFEF